MITHIFFVFQTIEVVAQAILATSIPQSEVLLTYQKANNAKTMAEQAQQITIDAEYVYCI